MFKPSVSGLGEVGAVLESGPHSLSLGEICNSLEFQRRFRYSLLSGWGGSVWRECRPALSCLLP